jgi:hypothetical protein
MKYPARLSYAKDKFNYAVYLLAVGPGDVRSRLKRAFIDFKPVQDQDIPDDLLEDFRSIVKELKKFEPVVRAGGVIAAPKRIQNRTGVKIAERIYNLAARLEDYYDQQMNERV